MTKFVFSPNRWKSIYKEGGTKTVSPEQLTVKWGHVMSSGSAQILNNLSKGLINFGELSNF